MNQHNRNVTEIIAVRTISGAMHTLHPNVKHLSIHVYLLRKLKTLAGTM